jgi:hypothetical protein
LTRGIDRLGCFGAAEGMNSAAQFFLLRLVVESGVEW